MAIKISGVLRDGMGKPIPKCTIELHCKKTSLTVVVETDALLGVDITGAYTMQVEPGKYDVSLYVRGFPPKRVGSIDVYADSLPGTLNDFLMIPGESDLTPELVLMFQQLRDEARQAADEARADKELVDDILTDVRSIQTDVTAKQQQVSADAQDASNSKTSAAASAATSSDNAASTAADVVTVTALKTSAESAASSAEASKNSASTDAERADQAAISAETSKTAASTDAARAEAARTTSEAIQVDLTQKYDQVVTDTAAVLAAKTEAVNAATAAGTDAQATAADRNAVSSDKQAVAADRELAQQAATTATEKTDVAIWEANRAKTEADRAAAATDGKQDKNDLLTAIAGLNTTANQIIYTTGVNEVTTSPIRAMGRLLLSCADAENARSAMGAADDSQVLKISNALSEFSEDEDKKKVLVNLGIDDVITESNSVFLKNGRVYKNNGTAQWGWDFFGANGEGMVWSSTASEAMGPSTPAIVVSPSGGGFNGWAARGTALQIQCNDAMNAAYSVWKAVQPGRAWIAGLDLYMPSNNVGLVMLHVNDSNFQFSGVGDFSIPGSVYCTSVVQTSDETKKSDIEVIENSDDIVSSWSGKTFTLNFNDRKSAGVIAQEVMEKFPVAVTVLPDGSLAVDYSALQAPMIEAMKNRINKEAELIKRIKALEKRLNTLAK